MNDERSYVRHLETGRRVYPKSPYPATPVNAHRKYPFYVTSDLTERYGIVFTFPAENTARAHKIWETVTGRATYGTVPQFRKAYSGIRGARQMVDILDGLDIHYVDVHVENGVTSFFLRDTGETYLDLSRLYAAAEELDQPLDAVQQIVDFEQE